MAKGEEQGFYRQNLCKNKVLVKLFEVLFSKIIKIPMKKHKNNKDPYQNSLDNEDLFIWIIVGSYPGGIFDFRHLKVVF